MKKQIFQITVIVALLIIGCSKDEFNSDVSENLKLKKGSTGNAGVASMNFFGSSAIGSTPYELVLLQDGSKVLSSGNCSGSITGYGKINPSLSYYRFSNPVSKPNPNYGIPGNERELPFDYDMSGTGTVCLNSRDYFDFTLTQALYSPANYEAGVTGPGEPLFKGAIFGCPIGKYYFIDGKWIVIYQGEAKITSGGGKFLNFKDRSLEVYRNGGSKGINRVTGEMNLIFYIK